MKTPEVEERRMQQFEANAERVGTIVVQAHDIGRRALRPQPSLDPNDPLVRNPNFWGNNADSRKNWTSCQKYSAYLTVCFFSFLTTANASKFTLAIVHLSEEFGKSIAEAKYLICFNVLALGIGNIFWVPLMPLIGKRLVILVSLSILVAGNVWSLKTHDFNQLLAASVLSGFASSTGEAVVPALAADLFFVHDRGTVLMIFHMALSSGFFLGPLIDAYITQYSSWRVSCEWIAVAAGATWSVAFFTVHETNYYNRDVYAPLSSYPRKRTFINKLDVTRGYNPQQSFGKALCSTVAVFAYPGILWSGITIGVFVGW
jgi:MFS family permease